MAPTEATVNPPTLPTVWTNEKANRQAIWKMRRHKVKESAKQEDKEKQKNFLDLGQAAAATTL